MKRQSEKKRQGEKLILGKEKKKIEKEGMHIGKGLSLLGKPTRGRIV